MILFEVYFEDGSILSIMSNMPMQAAITAQAKKIRHGLPFGIDSIRNEETGAVYKIEQKVIEVKK